MSEMLDLLDDSDIDTSYEPFSREPEYIEANRLFIETLDLRGVKDVLDLGCGTGPMSDLLLDRFLDPGDVGNAGAGAVNIVGVDPSAESLAHCRRHMTQRGVLGEAAPAARAEGGRCARVSRIIQAPGESVPLPDSSFDLAIMGNAIHLTRLDDLLSEAARVLRQGGQFVFNTSFYAGTYVGDTEQIYRRWVQEALAYIMAKDAEFRAAGHPGITRKRGSVPRAFSQRWLSPQEYAARMAVHGLSLTSSEERTLLLTEKSFEKIGAYSEFARILLSGYPVKLSCVALQHAAKPTLDAMQVESVPRKWLEMVAVKD